MSGRDLSQLSLPVLLEWAALPDPAQAGQARAELWRRCLQAPEQVAAVLRALAQASPEACEAAADWLCNPACAESWRLGIHLAQAAQEFLRQAQAQPGSWCWEGLAASLALRGGRPLARLRALARGEDWAAQALARLPARLRLPGGDTPALALARDQAGAAGVQRVRRLVRRQAWTQLAALGRPQLSLAQALAGEAPTARDAPALAWPGGDLELLEQMARITAREGCLAHELAQALSAQERRPVLLLGNASLGGPPLWAAAGPWQQGWGRLRPAAGRTAAALAALTQLARLRARRLAGAGLLRALWDFRCAQEVSGRGAAFLRQALEQARPWLLPEQIEQVRQGSLPFSLGELPLVQAGAVLRQAQAWVLACEEQGQRAVGLMWGLCAGAGRLARGQGLVLPWADKFVASTGRASDHVYLAELTALLARLDPPPLLLMLDETLHPAGPSLRLALAAAARRRPEVVLRGVGCLGGLEEPAAQPADLGQALLRAAQGAHLLACRVLPGEHPVATLSERLAGRALGRPLSPASRDGADWLLAGSALASLANLAGAGAWSSSKEPAPWLLTGQGFAPLGAWFRRRVRQLAGAEDPPPGREGGFWRGYQALANLD